MTGPVVVIQGAANASEVPGIERAEKLAQIRYAEDDDALKSTIQGADVFFGWNFRGGGLPTVWNEATALRWVQWAGAGVDAALFPEFANSDVTLTNCKGLFDRPMAEWVLGHIILFEKRIDETLAFQQKREWNYRSTSMVLGKRVLIVGVGSIGRECARLLKAVGLEVTGVGRSARSGDADFGHVHGIDELNRLLPDADHVVLITPLTEQTRGLFGAAQFEAMSDKARFINIGRGPLVDENALLNALESGSIAGAALDVFVKEPLDADNPLWSAPNCIVSPHMSGDTDGYLERVVDLFVDNLDRYSRGEPLRNVVDKQAGFVTA